MNRERALIFSLAIVAVAAIALSIELTGGLPSQMAHLYYLPVVAAALVLPLRYSLAVALLAAVAVSPLPDLLVHRPLGMDIYYEDVAPWALTSSGWIVRPLAFLAISLVASKVVEEQRGKHAALATSAVRGQELGILSQIDRLILGGASEDEALQEVARLVTVVTGAPHAEIATPDSRNPQAQKFYRHFQRPVSLTALDRSLPIGEGVSGWTLQHGTVATSRNVLEDPRYERMGSFARQLGYMSAAAVPIELEGRTLAALSIAYDDEHDFTGDELASLQRLADQAAVAVACARQRVSLQRLTQETVVCLADAIEGRDPYTGDHCARIAGYAVHTAAALGLSESEIDVVRLGAALHDVGKIVVPDHILKKPGELTPDEYAAIKQHCYSGGQICKRVSFLNDAYPIVYHHHERFDGRGYPDGITGERIPIGARIVSVADAFDAMTSNRPYRNALPDEHAFAILRDGAGTQWDPAVVKTFLGLRRGAQTAPALARAA